MSISLKDYLLLHEQSEKIEDITSFILKNYSQGKVDNLIGKKIPEYVDPGWDDEFETEEEWYNEYGQGEAEYDVITEIIQQASRKNNVNLSQTEFADLQNWFYKKYDI